jgi:hypothetical protein
VGPFVRFVRPLLAFGRAKSGRLRNLPALAPAGDVAAAFLTLALGRRFDPRLSHVSNVCPAILRGAFAVIRAIGPAETFKRLAAAATIDPKAAPIFAILALVRRHPPHWRGDQVAGIAASDYAPARHLEWIEAKCSRNLILNLALVTAKPGVAVAARAAIDE